MSETTQTLTVMIPLRVKQRGGRKAMVTPGVLALERRQDIIPIALWIDLSCPLEIGQ